MLMDDIDRKILKLLQENARMSLKTIAEKTFLSSPAVSARIEKLEKDGVIAGCVTGEYSMLMKVAFQSTMELDIFIGQLQKFGKTSTQIVFSTHVGPRGVDVEGV